jgi:hypothetical protein
VAVAKLFKRAGVRAWIDRGAIRESQIRVAKPFTNNAVALRLFPAQAQRY